MRDKGWDKGWDEGWEGPCACGGGDGCNGDGDMVTAAAAATTTTTTMVVVVVVAAVAVVMAVVVWQGRHSPTVPVLLLLAVSFLQLFALLLQLFTFSLPLASSNTSSMRFFLGNSLPF